VIVMVIEIEVWGHHHSIAAYACDDEKASHRHEKGSVSALHHEPEVMGTGCSPDTQMMTSPHHEVGEEYHNGMHGMVSHALWITVDVPAEAGSQGT